MYILRFSLFDQRKKRQNLKEYDRFEQYFIHV
jgi:hypothetical protein